MSAPVTAWAYFVLVATSAVLFYAAWTDLREYKIRNDLVLALAGLFVLYTAFTGRWTDFGWHLAFAAVMLVIMLGFYVRRWMGGGDIKILAAALLWTGTSCVIPFALLLVVFSSAHAIAASRGWVGSRFIGNGKRIPFAPSVAAALIGTFMLGCLNAV